MTATDRTTTPLDQADPMSVAAQLRQGMPDFSPGEKRIARTLLANYPAAGLDTAAVLAREARVSAPTVVRFVARLGYQGYRDFQSHLKHELTEREASPLTQTSRIDPGSDTTLFLSSAASFMAQEVQHTISSIPSAELEHAVSLLTNPRISIHTTGGRYSEILADYLHLHLRQMRARTHSLSVHGSGAATLLDLGRDDCLVVIDFRRYQEDVIAFSRAAHARKCSIILITDPLLSPIAEFADAVLPASVASPSPFDSCAPAFALIEVLIASLHHRLGAAAARRMTEYERESGLLT